MKKISFKNSIIEKWKPGVPKGFLLLIAGLMWISAAFILNRISYSQLRTEDSASVYLVLGIGFVSALVIHHFGFLRLVDKNLRRILPMEGARCVFSFVTWKDYIFIMTMIFMGVLLRQLPIPKLYLTVLYTGIGTALLLSSVRYLRYSILLILNKK